MKSKQIIIWMIFFILVGVFIWSVIQRVSNNNDSLNSNGPSLNSNDPSLNSNGPSLNSNGPLNASEIERINYKSLQLQKDDSITGDSITGDSCIGEKKYHVGCPAVFEPVLGCDNKVYSNSCYAMVEGIKSFKSITMDEAYKIRNGGDS